MYTYFTKQEIEAKISRMKACGRVVVDLKKGDGTALVRCGSDGAFEKTAVDDMAKMLASNDTACATVDCDEGMMVFGSPDERDEYMKGQ